MIWNNVAQDRDREHTFWEHGSEPVGSAKDEKRFNLVSEYHLLKISCFMKLLRWSVFSASCH
jgi:hypothetical protein